jgi:hypothetical protein
MRTLLILLLVTSTACMAMAKPKPPVKVENPLPEIVEHEDAVAALEARARLGRALAEVQIAEIAWKAAQTKFDTKYQTKIGEGDGWDEDKKDGKLHIRRGGKDRAK